MFRSVLCTETFKHLHTLNETNLHLNKLKKNQVEDRFDNIAVEDCKCVRLCANLY